MSKETLDYNDAKLVLKLYEMRREPVMRESRDKLNFTFLPRSYDDFLNITQPTSPFNQAFRQVSSYWEMAYSFARHGIINADFLAENAGEGLFLYAKIEPFLQQFRQQQGTPNAFANAEWLAKNSAVAQQRLEMIKTRIKQMLEAKK